ncbi:MAG: class II aldolase/adducin family protein, partial [Spirochaetaceae bacterium]|nr:class II aldolase/adducin family protein [Spirochaetaceae bacterium]
CHTHSSYATAWAQSMYSVPILGTTHADHTPYPIPCTRLLTEIEVIKNYEINTGKVIVEAINNPKSIRDIATLGPFPKLDKLNVMENPMILVAGHGPFCWGKNAADSVYTAAVLEECCKMALFVKNISGSFSVFPQYIVNKHYERKHGRNAYYGQS